MRIRPTAKLPIEQWPVATRLRLPYLFRPIEVVEHPPEDPGTSEQQQFLIDPIHPHVLNLKAGDPDSIVAFVSNLGLSGLVEWVRASRWRGSPVAPAWVPLFEAHDEQLGWVLWEDLAAAWTAEETVDEFSIDHDFVLEAFEYAAEIEDQVADPVEAAMEVLGSTRISTLLEIDLFPDPLHGRLVEHPVGLISRSAHELVDALEARGLPKTCAHCGNPFLPRRSNQRYCTGTNCQQRAYDKRKSRRRTEYHRMYGRWRRGTITDQEFQDWKQHQKTDRKG